MRCKVGDLAIVTRSVCGNEGKIVRCLRLLDRTTRYGLDGSRATDWDWAIDRELVDCFGTWTREAQDSCLCPIRGDESGDTTTESEKRPDAVTA